MRPRRPQVGCINALALQEKPPPPRMAVFKHYTIIAALSAILQYPTSDSPHFSPCHKKAAKKVRQVTASCRTSASSVAGQRTPFLLPTRLPPFTPGVVLNLHSRARADWISVYPNLVPPINLGGLWSSPTTT